MKGSWGRDPVQPLAAAGLLIVLACIPPRVLPADPDCISIGTRAEVRREMTDEQGRTVVRLAPAEKIAPGEEVFYTVRAVNRCPRPAEALAIDVPVPEHMRYVPGSAVAPAAGVLFSVDGGFRYAPPDELHVPTAQGEPRPTGSGDYTHIRWMLRKPLPAGAVVLARFRAMIE
jgi:uncharacterized repeat protein (TIGR01451 family)